MPEDDQAQAGAASGAARMRAPESILDLVNYQMHQIETLNASRVTRICEGRFGITRREWRLIALLATFGPMAPSDIALRAALDRSRTSKALLPLRAKGLVERSVQPGDARRAMVALTPSGHAIYAQIFPDVKRINTELLAVLDESDLAQLERLLGLLRARARELVRSRDDEAPADRRRGGSRRAWERGQGG
ncbi:MAG: winged helix-turn-helix transcriptional regulator [Burkholderiales bacterium]|nr:winged helix-turn-helix transcriptional regulator [Burkholderiales bacterium]